MPYPVQLLDAELVSQASVTGFTFPLTVGSSFGPGDLRVVYFQSWQSVTASSFPGWTKQVDVAGPLTGRIFLFTKLLTGSDVDGLLTVTPTPLMYMRASVTVHNPNLAQSFALTNTSAPAASRSFMSNASVTATANGILLNYSVLGGNVANPIATSDPSMAQLGEMEVDDGTAYWATLFSAENYTTAGATGTKNHPVSPTGSWDYQTSSLYLQQNPDVVATAGTATSETDTANAATAALLNTTTVVCGTATETDIASQAFTPLTGYRVSPPLPLPQSPITNSVIHWDQVAVAAGSTVTVESSIDNGATWQVCASDEPIPRLLFGYNVATTLLTRVTLYRANVADPTPRVSNLEVRVATDSSNDELVSLGVFYITSTEITMSGGSGTGSSGSGGGGSGVTGSGGGSTGGALSILISGVDQSRQVSRNTWQDVYYIPANTNYATAIRQIIDNRLPGLQYNFQSTPMKTPKIILGTQLGNDPWQDAQDMATAIGFELFFDAGGACTLREVPNPATGQSVWTFTDQANPTIAQLDRTLTDQTTYNYVIVYGESVDNTVPVQAVAFDNDPSSPTYYLGPYGIVSTTFQSPLITTTAQAQAAANALLLAVKGASENVALTVVPNPALEPGDVVTVEVGDAQISGTFLINDIQTPLSAAQGQTLTVYRQSS